LDDINHEIANLPDLVSRGLAGYQNRMADYLFEMAHMDGLDELGTMRVLPYLLLKYFQKVMDLYDESVRFLLGRLRRSGVIIQCRPLCSHCCHHMPAGVGTMELIYIYHAMNRSRGMDRMFRHTLEAEESWAEIRKPCALDPKSGDGTDFTEAEAFDRYQRLRQPCPFLEGSMCQIYLYRPLACRMHFSLSPPYWCHPSHFQNSNAVRFNLEPGESVFDALEQLNNRFHLHLSDVMVPGLLQMIVNVMQFREIRWSR
jgi:Fe-S-cluster containining protein